MSSDSKQHRCFQLLGADSKQQTCFRWCWVSDTDTFRLGLLRASACTSVHEHACAYTERALMRAHRCSSLAVGAHPARPCSKYCCWLKYAHRATRFSRRWFCCLKHVCEEKRVQDWIGFSFEGDAKVTTFRNYDYYSYTCVVPTTKREQIQTVLLK